VEAMMAMEMIIMMLAVARVALVTVAEEAVAVEEEPMG
jgi:hypothetical protein